MKSFRRFFLLTGLVLMAVVCDRQSLSAGANEANDDKTSDDNEFAQYIGYGYDITGGPLYDTSNSLHLNYPILDVNNAELMRHVKLFTPTKTTYISGSYTKKVNCPKILEK